MKEKPNIKNQLIKINITNMTKVSVFGQQSTETKELKKIEFVEGLDAPSKMRVASRGPSSYENVMLLELGYFNDGDLIMAWDNIDDKMIYRGYWNDGVV